MKFIIKFLGWVTFLLIAFSFLGSFLPSETTTKDYTESTPVPVKKINYEYIQADYKTINSQVGCDSKYSKEKSNDIWRREYKDKRMIWRGEIVYIKKNEVSLNMDGQGIQDIIVKIRNESVAYDLLVGNEIEVDFLLSSRGGCFLPFIGDDGVVKKIITIQ